jgi:hypothetical protein
MKAFRVDAAFPVQCQDESLASVTSKESANSKKAHWLAPRRRSTFFFYQVTGPRPTPCSATTNYCSSRGHGRRANIDLQGPWSEAGGCH